MRSKQEISDAYHHSAHNVGGRGIEHAYLLTLIIECLLDIRSILKKKKKPQDN